MKLIIQIPAYNEEDALKVTLPTLPRKVNGIDTVEWLIIDDGSVDNTVDVAKSLGVDHVIQNPTNLGLAKTFMNGIQAGLSLGADIIVNTDADNQYNADDIETLVQPILERRAQIVIGERPIATTQHFSFTKKVFQKFGSFMVRRFSGTRIPDAPSGFRAYSREAALRLNVFTEYTYTIETIIQAGKLGIQMMSVPIRTNEDLRPSRLLKSIPQYINQGALTMVRVMNTYKPMRTFLTLGVIPLTLGVILGARWMILYMHYSPARHIPSLILAAILIVIGVQFCLFGCVADVVSVNRKLLEDIQYRLRRIQYDDPQ